MASTQTQQPPLSPAAAQRLVRCAVEAVDAIVTGHTQATKVVVATLLARGHVLLEDVPGVGKTTLARAMAQVLDVSFSRIQFTADMLPGDVLGLQVFDSAKQKMTFRKGPLFAELILADEINRASPKTQSAMLEAMAERRVTIDSETHALPELFCVLATQNPSEHHGAYPLPESQLDRFMVRLNLGYPQQTDEARLVMDPGGPVRRLAQGRAALSHGDLVGLQQQTDSIGLHQDVAQYMLAIVGGTRRHPEIALGISPRGSLALAQLARAWALMAGREYVIPDDIKEMAPHALTHRLVMRGGSAVAGAALAAVTELLATTQVPR